MKTRREKIASSFRKLNNNRSAKRAATLSLAAIGIAAGFIPHSAHAATFTWTANDTTGVWNSSSLTTDWKSATYPNVAGAIAQYTSGAGVTSLNVNATVGELYCSGGGGANWNISGASNTITLDGTGFAGNNIFADSNAAIYMGSGANTFVVNSNLALTKTDLDIGSNNTGGADSIQIGATSATTLLNAGTTLRTINIKDGDKNGNNNYNVQFYSGIGTSGGAIAINDVSVSGNVAFDGAIGSSVTTVTINQTGGRTFFGNTGNAFTGNLTIGSTSDLTLEQRYASTVSGQVIPYGANAGNVINNGTLDLEGNSQQINGLSGTGNINISNWDGSVGAINDTLTVGNNNATATYSGTIGVGDYSASRAIYLVKTGTGTQTFNNSGDTITGAITISGGTLQIGDGTNATASLGANAFTDNANLAYNYNGAVSVANVITGTGSVTQSGSAALTLTAATNTFSGGLNINSSSVVAGNASAGVLGSGTVTMGASTLLDINANSPTTGLLSSSFSSATVTNSGAADGILTLSGTGTASFAGIIGDGSTNKIGITKLGVGSQTFSGFNTYSGPTTVNAGKLFLGPTATLGNTAITVNSGGMFSPRPGTGTNVAGSSAAGTLGATLTLNPGTGSLPGGLFDITDNAIGVFDLNQQAGFTGPALTLGGAGSSSNAPILTFELGANSADELAVSTGAVSLGATGADITISPLAGLTSLTPGNYTIIAAPGGGLTPLTLTASSVVVGTTSYGLSLTNSTSTAEILTVSATSTTPINAYWTGTTSTSWSATGPTNFATDNTGATVTAGIPGGGTNVFMTADGASSANLSTTLDSAFNINSLTFTGTGTTAAGTSVTVAAGTGGSLTLAAANAFQNSSGTSFGPGIGIVVQAGSAAHTISAPVILGASQTWEIDNAATSPLTISGIVSDAGMAYSLTKTGVGTLVLSGVNTYGGTTGSTTVSGGNLVAAAVGAIPAGTALTINGGTLDLDGFSQSVSNLSDGGVSTGSIIDSGGAATLNTSSSITTTFSGTINAANATLVVNGSGSATLSGVNTLSSLVQNAGAVSLTASNTINNGVTVNGGTLTVSSTGLVTGSTASFVAIGDNGNMTVNGGTVNVANFYTNSKGTSATIFNSGSTIIISGGLNVDNDNGAGGASYLLLAGGSITSNGVLIGRTGFSSGGGTIVTAGTTGSGIYITSGTLTDTGTLSLGTNAATNSNANLRMDNGILNVSGATTVTANTTRISTLDINGGTFTTPSVQLGGGFQTSAGELLVRGTGVANVGAITFGNATQTAGVDALELLGGTLYVGSGGMVNNSTGVTPTINLGGTAYATAPVLAASAPWSSSLAMTLTNSSGGIAPIIQAANASGGAVNITLTGGIGGAAGFNKTGAGTLFLSGAGNFYTGITTITAGTLNINSNYALGGALYAGLTFNGGTLQYANPLLNAVTDLTFNGSNAVPVTIKSGGATIDTNGNNINFVNSIGNNGSGSLTLIGGGTLNVSGGTYTGATTVLAGSTLHANAAGALAPLSAYNVNTGTLDVTAGIDTVAALNVAATGTLNLSFGSILTVTGAATFSGGTLNLLGTSGTLPEILINYNTESGTFASGSVSGIPTNDKLAYTATALELVSVGPSTLTWNNTGGSGDGATWDTTNQNWNNGTGVTTYSDTSNGSSGDIVTFNDTNNSHYAVTINGTVSPTSTTFNNSAGNYTVGGVNSSSGIAGPGSLTLLGTGTVTVSSSNTYTGGTNVSAGKLILASANAFPANTSLTIASGAAVTIANHSSNTTCVPIASSLTNSGTIDITNNAMVVHNGSIGTITAQVATAYNGGAWNGSGGSGVITSSVAAADASHLTAVGVATGLTSFEGLTVSATDVLVKYTYYGDANLDGHVDGTDYSRMDNGYLMNLTGWSNGDFNYDGVIDGSDYTLIDNAYNTQGASIAAELATPTAQIAAGGSSAVPEPATLGLLGIGAMGLLGRRNRRRR